MRKRWSVLRIFVCILLIASVLLLCTCNRDDDKTDKDSQRRENATTSVVDAFLNGIDKDWNSSIDDNTLSTMDDAGDYIVTLGWTSLICDVVNSSSMQTEKIEALAKTLESEETKTMLANFAENAELLIPLLKQTGVTASDISNLVIGLMNSLVLNSEKALDDMMTRLNQIKTLAVGNASVQASVNNGIANVNSAKRVLTPALSDKQGMIRAFDNAKNAVSEIVEFAYTMSMDSIAEDLLNALLSDDGALAGITNGELITLTNTLMQNVTALKNALTPSEIEYLNIALDLVIEKFDTNVIASQIYAEIVKFSKYAYTLVDVIPAICDIVVAGGGVLSDEDFLDRLKVYADGSLDVDDATNNVNAVILFAKVVDEVMTSFEKQDLIQMVEMIASNSVDEYQKAVPLMFVDVMLNLGAIAQGTESGQLTSVHPSVLPQDVLMDELSLVLFFNGGIDAFKKAYYDYQNGKVDVYYLQQKANECSFGDFGVNNPFSPIGNTKGWYEYYIGEGINAVNSRVEECMTYVIDDLKLFVQDYYADNSSMKSAISTLADMSLFSQSDDMEDYLSLLSDSRLMGVMFMDSLFGGVK